MSDSNARAVVRETGKLVSVLTGIFGIDRLQLAEDVVQESLVKAMQTWPYYGVPKNPAAWLTQTAKHLALAAHLRKALQLADLKSVQSLLSQRLAAVELQVSGSCAGR